MSQFTLTENVLVKGFEGYGAQLNQNVFAQITRDLGVTDAHLQELPGHVRRLAPRFVRIFLDPRARHGQVPSSDDLMQSFKKTVELAQSAASSINITWTGGGAPGTMTSFADVLADLVANHGATKLRWVTIMNEPNSTKISLDDYTALYQALHHELETRGLASQVRLMGGDLVQTHQEAWCHHLETMFRPRRGVVDPHLLEVRRARPRREDEARQTPDGRAQNLERLQRRAAEPLYVTEYGVQGTWKVQQEVVQPDGTKKKKWVIVQPEPGTYKPQGPNLGGPRVVDQNVNAFQHAWFNLLAANLGYRGLVKWDAYFAKYDLQPEPHPQEYGMIGKPTDSGWQLRQSYYLTRLFTQTVKPGWNVRELAHGPGSQIVPAYSAPSGRGLTLTGLDTAGATLNEAVPEQRSYQFSKLPAKKAFALLVLEPARPRLAHVRRQGPDGPRRQPHGGSAPEQRLRRHDGRRRRVAPRRRQGATVPEWTRACFGSGWPSGASRPSARARCGNGRRAASRATTG